MKLTVKFLGMIALVTSMGLSADAKEKNAGVSTNNPVLCDTCSGGSIVTNSEDHPQVNPSQHEASPAVSGSAQSANANAKKPCPPSGCGPE